MALLAVLDTAGMPELSGFCSGAPPSDVERSALALLGRTGRSCTLRGGAAPDVEQRPKMPSC